MGAIALGFGVADRGRRRARARHADVHPDLARLLGQAAWAELPPAVRDRFTDTATRVYEGAMSVRASTAGFLFAQACRLIGTPLAPWRGEDMPVCVTVWRRADGAMVWDRVYRFPRRGPVKVGSCKKADRRGLVEVVRGGLGMALDVTVEDRTLHFRSRGYFWEVLGLRIALPALMTPGAAHVFHRDEGGGRFTFGLRFTHPWLGETFWQEGLFNDPPTA
jgi:hypothetical protein